MLSLSPRRCLSSPRASLRKIQQASLTWYRDEFDPTTYQGFPASIWYYDPIANTQKEDLGHAQHGIIGMHHLDTIGGYTNYPDRRRMGNTIRYAVHKPATDGWSHKVDGSGTVYTNIQPGFILLSRSVDSLYSLVGNDQINAGKVPTNPDVVAYILWAKQARYTGNWKDPKYFSGYYKILARHSGKAVVMQSASTADGANVFQYAYGGSSTNDEWEIRGLGDGYYRIVNRNSGKDMVVQGASTAEGANIFQFTYGGSLTNDEWAIVGLGGGYYRITNRNSGKSAEVASGSTANGANVVQRTYGGATYQQFQILRVP